MRKIILTLALGFMVINATYAYGASGELEVDGDTYLATQSGSVGIGTTDPGAKLHVIGGSYISGGNGDVSGNNNVSALDSLKVINWLNKTASLTDEEFSRADITGDGLVTWIDLRLLNDWINAHPAGNLIGVDNNKTFKRDLCSRLTAIQISPTGYVGIGVSEPTVKLDVSGDVHVSGTIMADGGIVSAGGNGDVDGGGFISANDFLSIVNWLNGSARTAEELSRADVDGDSIVTLYDYEWLLEWYNSHLSGTLIPPDENLNYKRKMSNRLRNITITSNDTVGIGTTSPFATLDVGGTMGRSSFRVGGSAYIAGGSGDASINGSLSPMDVLTVANFLNGSTINEFQYAAADITGDGLVTALDLQLLIDWINTHPSGNLITQSSSISMKQNQCRRESAISPQLNGNVGIGTSTPLGKLDVNGTIYQRGSSLHSDYVFKPGYELESIEDHAEYMWREKHLQAIPKATVNEDGKQVIEVGANSKGILEELEKAHIYIEDLNKRIKILEAKLADSKE